MCSTSSYSYHTFYCHYTQWRIRGAWPPPYFSSKMRPKGRKKVCLETSPPPFSQGVDDRYPPSLSEGLDPPLTLTTDTTLTTYTTLTTLTPATTLTTHTTATTLTTHTTLTTATTVTAATTTWGHNSVPRGTTWH